MNDISGRQGGGLLCAFSRLELQERLLAFANLNTTVSLLLVFKPFSLLSKSARRNFKIKITPTRASF